MIHISNLVCLTLQARKQHSRAEKICNIALDQITQYISSWGNYYYLTYQLPLPSILENGEDEEVGEEGKVIRSKLRVIQEEVESTVANWEEATKVLDLQRMPFCYIFIVYNGHIVHHIEHCCFLL